MTTADQVLKELKAKSTPQTLKTLKLHGAPEDTYGVKIGDLKTIVKRIKHNQALALELYETGNSDAMYLAGMIADGSQMSKRQLESWAKNATWQMLSEYTVPGVTTESRFARELALKWIRSRKESMATSGWTTYAGILATAPDDELDLQEIQQLLDQVVEQIDTAPDRVRYTMNSFVISVGAYVKPLLKQAKRAAKQIGVVSIDMGDTACKVPLATESIAKIEAAGRVGKKRKTLKC